MSSARTPRAVAGSALAAIGVALAWPAPARADGELTARGMYYKEERTRVMQPMLDATFDVGERGTGDAHFLVDAITSASLSAGPDNTGFTELRYEAGGTYRRQLERLRLGGTLRYSTEPDYKSGYGALHADLELFDKNLTVSATVGGGHDVIDPPGTLGPETLNVVLGSLSVSQIVSEHGVVGLSYDLIHLDGFQSNIYRNVRIGGGADIAHETHPDTRTRHAIAASLKWFFPRLDATVIGQYRFYADDWDLHANTPELRVTKNVGDWIVVGARYRYHRQDAAEFYRDQYDVMETYVTDDPKLAAFDSHLVGARFELTAGALGVVDRLQQARIELVGEYIVQHNDFGDAIVSYASLVLPFEY